jgi:hypothetical protein
MTLYDQAVLYIENEILHNTSWTEADVPKRNRALKNAENELYNEFPRYNRDTKPLPETAIFEQAVWLLRKDDSILRAEQGVTNINLSGEFSMGLGGKVSKISPNAIRFIRSRKVGRYV